MVGHVWLASASIQTYKAEGTSESLFVKVEALLDMGKTVSYPEAPFSLACSTYFCPAPDSWGFNNLSSFSSVPFAKCNLLLLIQIHMG